ncbi:MAG: methylenetetrahydrofolate reductase [NAD(P)H] [Magnetococcales bacterium]|nr:methylenetetrahydrofolate reductase [NAD(P)H] [Magnetococcales bacterium]
MNRPTLSFEFFPPKTGAGEAVFWQTLTQLARYRPDFISVTYGAGGGNRADTARLVCQAQNRFNLTAMAHLTCIGDTRANLDALLRHYQDNGIRHILALRGDRTPQMSADILNQGDFTSSVPLVAYIHHYYPHFRVGVACYPEIHPEARDRGADIAFFVKKVHAGAQFAITQFFYDNAALFRFVEEAYRIGGRIPIIPGILPITDFRQVQRFAAIAGAALPSWLVESLERVRDDRLAMMEIGVEVAVRQCRELLAWGVPGLHFFALNRSEAVSRVLDEIGTGMGMGSA